MERPGPLHLRGVPDGGEVDGDGRARRVRPVGSAIGTGVAGAAVEGGLMMPLALCGGAMLAGRG